MIEFLKAVSCDGKPFRAGAVVPREAVPPDHLACCLRMGYAREVPSPEPPPEHEQPAPEPPAPEPEPEQPAPAPKKKK